MFENPYFKELGYKPRTTLFNDFWIANAFGKSAIIDTYNRAFNCLKDNYVYMTEMVLVLNHCIWLLYEKNETLARVYNDLWQKLDNWYFEYYKGNEDAIQYYLRTTD